MAKLDPLPYEHTHVEQRYPDQISATHFAYDMFRFAPRPEFSQDEQEYI